ncbi:unnamed protein product [Pedinophyceae sp. YPF-701]|nr:unnamed protein product [Pedinophyceae sp. YPF-701]
MGNLRLLKASGPGSLATDASTGADDLLAVHQIRAAYDRVVQEDVPALLGSCTPAEPHTGFEGVRGRLDVHDATHLRDCGLRPVAQRLRGGATPADSIPPLDITRIGEVVAKLFPEGTAAAPAALDDAEKGPLVCALQGKRVKRREADGTRASKKRRRASGVEAAGTSGWSGGGTEMDTSMRPSEG